MTGAEDTRDRLREAALTAVRELGIAGISARTIAARAGCNQASIYYHFGSIPALLADASERATRARVERFRERFAAVTSIDELLEVGRELHADEHERGNVAVLAQMVAGAQTDPALREPTAAALQLWIDEIETTLHRLLDGTPVAELVDVPVLARGVSAAFVGIELFDGVAGDERLPTLDALADLAGLLQVVLDLGPVASAALRRRVRRGDRGR